MRARGLVALFLAGALLGAPEAGRAEGSREGRAGVLDFLPMGLAFADVASTDLVLQRGGSEVGPGARALGTEGRLGGGAVALRLGGQAAFSYAAWRMGRSGRPEVRKAGKILKVVYCVAGGVVVAHNLRQAGRTGAGKGGR